MKKAHAYALMVSYLAALVFAYVAPVISAISEAAAFVIYRVTTGTILMAVLIVPTAREFIAVRRARRAAGWQ